MMPTSAKYGAIAQLGERYNGIVEVSGSIPLSSTIYSSSNIQESPQSPQKCGFFYGFYSNMV